MIIKYIISKIIYLFIYRIHFDDREKSILLLAQLLENNKHSISNIDINLKKFFILKFIFIIVILKKVV